MVREGTWTVEACRGSTGLAFLPLCSGKFRRDMIRIAFQVLSPFPFCGGLRGGHGHFIDQYPRKAKQNKVNTREKMAQPVWEDLSLHAFQFSDYFLSLLGQNFTPKMYEIGKQKTFLIQRYLSRLTLRGHKFNVRQRTVAHPLKRFASSSFLQTHGRTKILTDPIFMRG